MRSCGIGFYVSRLNSDGDGDGDGDGDYSPSKPPQVKKARVGRGSRARGNPSGGLPMAAKGGVLVHSLGVVSDMAGYHKANAIWPIGFLSTRPYFSAVRPDGKVNYTSSIEEGPDGPLFRVVADDDKDHPIVEKSPGSAWMRVVSRVNEMKAPEQRRKKVTVSGPEMFGLSDPRVRTAVEQLPNIERCHGYIRLAPGAGAGKPLEDSRGIAADVPPAALALAAAEQSHARAAAAAVAPLPMLGLSLSGAQLAGLQSLATAGYVSALHPLLLNQLAMQTFQHQQVQQPQDAEPQSEPARVHVAVHASHSAVAHTPAG